MRLASKIFAASTLVVLALVGVAGWSLLAVDRLVRAHREIISHSLPALQAEASLREGLGSTKHAASRYRASSASPRSSPWKTMCRSTPRRRARSASVWIPGPPPTK